MEQKIDINKIWDAIAKTIETTEALKVALKNQDMQYNSETKKIESIEQLSDHKLMEDAANEPIEQNPKFKFGDRVRNKKSGLEQTLGSCIEDVYEGAFPFRIKDQDDWELVEQKPADKVKPKFKVGDYIVYRDYVWKVFNISLEKYYELLKINNEVSTRSIEDVDNNAHLWTINDAKDGDVLACESGWTCIFKTLVNNENFSSYCFMDNTKWFCETGSECHTLKEEFVKAYNGKIYPATKEQRDTLMKAMKEAGYVFLSKRKKLVKLLFKEGDTVRKKFDSSIWHISFINEIGYWDHHKPLFPIEDQNEFELVEPKQEWEPQPGDIFRKKGTERPTYTLCSKKEDGFHYGFIQNMEEGVAGGKISDITLKENYELVERTKTMEEILDETFKPIEKIIEQRRDDPEAEQKAELTEFEQALQLICNELGASYSCKTALKSDAKELLSIARKKFIEEFCEWLRENIYYRVYKKGDNLGIIFIYE